MLFNKNQKPKMKVIGKRAYKKNESVKYRYSSVKRAS